jgi:putative hydrolase of HD superfamily
MTDRDRLTRLADFLFEVGMLRKTPRTGYQFLGSGAENVAEHSFRTAVIGFVLAEMRGADPLRTMALCLFHDLHEARTGDFNYVNHAYNRSDRVRALQDATRGTGLSAMVLGMWEELEGMDTLEARLAQDADQIDLILNLKEQADLGNGYASKWLACALERLRTEQGRALARHIAATDHTDWWFLGRRAVVEEPQRREGRPRGRGGPAPGEGQGPAGSDPPGGPAPAGAGRRAGRQRRARARAEGPRPPRFRARPAPRRPLGRSASASAGWSSVYLSRIAAMTSKISRKASTRRGRSARRAPCAAARRESSRRATAACRSAASPGRRTRRPGPRCVPRGGFPPGLGRPGLGRGQVGQPPGVARAVPFSWWFRAMLPDMASSPRCALEQPRAEDRVHRITANPRVPAGRVS